MTTILFLLVCLAFRPLAPAAALGADLLEQRLPEADEATLAAPVRDGDEAVVLKSLEGGGGSWVPSSVRASLRGCANAAAGAEEEHWTCERVARHQRHVMSVLCGSL